MPFVLDLDRHGDRTAIVTTSGRRVSYQELDGRIDETARLLGPGRRLVAVAASTATAPLVTYLAALRARHPVLLAPPEPRTFDALVAAWDPDVVLAPAADRPRERRGGSAHTLHPELALLLSTSGTTGSPKLVRLSHAAIAANAAAIAGYLDIRPGDRALASLPPHYCYGLSVVNSNLLRGAALVLCDRSAADPAFLDLAARERVTSLHGVPHTFELLDRAGFADRELPALRYVTQAGGRMAPERVRRTAALGRSRGWRLYVMYGQTEATARMAYLPPELAETRPGAIGVAIPGGSFALVPTPDGEAEELVYRGPNVMLGYAERPADLARGAEVDALATGDLARRTPDGLYELIGRRTRFVKPFGLRVDLDRVEVLLAADGIAAAVTGDDDGLALAVTGGRAAAAVAAVAERTGLPPAHVRAVAVADLPRLASGKTDYAAVATRVRAAPRPDRQRSARGVLARVLGEPVRDGDTFVGLGGDSLRHVQASIALEAALGRLPPDWPTRTVAELEAQRTRRRLLAMIDTTVVLRALAMITIVGSHVGVFRLLGGAHLLLALSGFSLARFLLDAGHATRRIAAVAAAVAAPTVAWILWRSTVQDDVAPRNALLLNVVLDQRFWGYWYVETLVQLLLVVAVLLAVAPVRRLERAHPFEFALGLLAVALAARGLAPAGEFTDRFMSPQLVGWILVLGWVVARAATRAQRAVAAGLVVVLLPGFFGDPVREGIVAGGLLLVLVAPRVPVPRVLAPAVGLLAAASLYVYLTHYAVYPLLLAVLPPWPVVAACLAVGVTAWWLVQAGSRGACRTARWAAARTRAPRDDSMSERDENSASPSVQRLFIR